MLNSLRSSACALVLSAVAATHAGAQDDTAPLSAIDWLSQQSTTPVALPQSPDTGEANEPDVAASASIPSVTVTPLGGPAPQRVGLVPSTVTGLPDTLWSGRSGAALAAQVKRLPTLRLPALQQLTYTLLLAEAAPPPSASAQFDLARIDALMDFGALDPALALMELAGPTTTPGHFKRYFDMAILSGLEAAACQILLDKRDLSPSTAHEVFCLARAGDWNTAALLLGSGRALGMIEPAVVDALERFLDPDLFEDAAPLAVPSHPDPLVYRLHSAIGTPIPTRILPLIYANADLSDTAGWKAQIEAAERLAARGTVPENRLLGLYTQRRAAASGGVWDRVAALQRFETALKTGSAAAVSKTLPATWRAMDSVRLRVPFANLFAEDLAGMVLSGPTADVAFEVLLLSPQYESAVKSFPTRALKRPVLGAIATGTVPPDLSEDGVTGAVLAAFRGAAPDPAIIEMAQSGILGQALLDTIALTHAGGEGDIAQLTTGLATLRALGLEDVARRTALQVLLLGGAT